MLLVSLPPESLFYLCLQVTAWLVCLNAATWSLATIDRRRWAFGGQRLSETALLWLALIGGWPGLLIGLRKSAKVRYDYTFRGWIRTAIIAQVLFGGLCAVPQGGLSLAVETAVAMVAPSAMVSDGNDRPGKVVLDSERGKVDVSNVVSLSAEP